MPPSDDMGPSDEIRAAGGRNASLGGEGWPPWAPDLALERALAPDGLSPWARVGEPAGLQHGVVALGQLHRLGLSAGAARKASAARRLIRLHSGVYAVGHPAVGDRGQWMAGVLACGPASYLSNSASGALHKVTEARSGPVDVSVFSGGIRRHPGVRVHRVRSLTPADVTEVDGIPTTSVARVLLDLAAEGRRAELDSAIGRAQRARSLDVAAVAALIDRCRGHRGVARLRLETEGLLPYGGVPKSEFERRFRRLFETHRLPKPVINGLIALEHCTLQVDFHWPEARLVVEADGYASHSDKSAHEQDRWRDQELKRAGWEVLRFTWRQLIEEPARTAQIIAELLEARLPHRPSAE